MAKILGLPNYRHTPISAPLRFPQVLAPPCQIPFSVNPNPKTKLGMSYCKSHAFIPKATEWIIDTGSTVHITSNRALLENPRELMVPPILAADGSPIQEMFLHVQTCGDVRLCGGSIILSDVRCIEDLRTNVLSVGCLCDKSDAAVFFAADECYILEKSSQKTIAVARKDPIRRCFVLRH